jgi:ornithine cyclodeaminase
MRDGDILILKGHEVLSLLGGRELELIELVRAAYVAHGSGDSSLPHSTFLRFPNHEKNRIIALPAYLGGEFGVTGIKWVSSFPDNVHKKLDRASAAVILNSPLTGRPEAFVEGSIISARRTAASAALAARTLQGSRRSNTLGLLGCGPINYEVTRFTLAACPEVRRLVVFDLEERRALQFKEKCGELAGGLAVEVAGDVQELLRESPLVSMATTAIKPHIDDLSACPPGATILHVSLRDLTPELILSCDNVVDDLDHVCRAQTSIHLAEQLTGHRDFVRCSLSDILSGRSPARRDEETVSVFSPFGLGVLDLAVAKRVRELAREQNQGTIISSFLPPTWEAWI